MCLCLSVYGYFCGCVFLFMCVCFACVVCMLWLCECAFCRMYDLCFCECCEPFLELAMMYVCACSVAMLCCSVLVVNVTMGKVSIIR